MKRYIVKANGKVIGKFISKKQASKFYWHYLYECVNQDNSFVPKMEIEVEMLESEV